jgi:hypothetical protein
MGGDFDSDKDLTHEVYEKLFQGMNLPAVTPESKQCQPTWAKDEIELMRQVLLHGLSLFRTCTVEKV